MDVRQDQRLLGLLTPAEQQRAASINGAGRQAFVAARALIRTVLSVRLGEAPHSIAVVNTCRVCGSHDHGQPTLPGLDLAVSISHSDGRVGVALAPKPVGIDIEAVGASSEQATRRLVEYALTPTERRAWDALPPGRRAAASVAWWTRKESVLKALGWGLTIAPDLLEVTGPEDRPAVTRWAPAAIEILGFELPVVHLQELDPGPGHVGFLASVGGTVNIIQQVVDLQLDSLPPGAQ